MRNTGTCDVYVAKICTASYFMSGFILLQNELLFQPLSLLRVHMSLFWSTVIYVDGGSELEATVGNDDLFMLTV